MLLVWHCHAHKRGASLPTKLRYEIPVPLAWILIWHTWQLQQVQLWARFSESGQRLFWRWTVLAKLSTIMFYDAPQGPEEN